MKRRILAILLALLLMLMLCEMHVCCGEDCVFCAQTESVRRISAFAVVCIWTLCLCGRVRAEAVEAPERRRFVLRSLVDLKVELTD